MTPIYAQQTQKVKKDHLRTNSPKKVRTKSNKNKIKLLLEKKK